MKYEEVRVAEAARMAFRARERAEDIIAKAKTKTKLQAKAGVREMGREDVIEWGGTRIKMTGCKKVVVEDDNVKEEVRDDDGALLVVAMAAAE